MIRRLCSVRRGQNMVEFAFVGSLLMLLTVGTVEVGLAIWGYNSVAHLAREGARYGTAPTRTVTQIEDHVFSRAVLPDFNRAACAGRDPSCVTVVRGICGPAGSPVVVTVTYPHRAASVMIAGLMGTTMNLQASASMYVEQGVAGVGACP